MLTAVPLAGQTVHLAHGQGQRLGLRRVAEDRLAVGFEVRGRLAVGDDQQHRRGVRVPAQVPAREQQRVVQVGALSHTPVEPGELARCPPLRVAAEGDQLQRVAAEPGRISWCSASAVRFIGTQRPSCTIEHDVSTHSATAARVRCSVSTTSTSSTSSSRAAGRCRRCAATALATVRGTSHGSVSPNAHGRRGARWARRPPRPGALALAAPAAQLVGDIAQQRLRPSRRIALGESRSEPSEPRSK